MKKFEPRPGFTVTAHKVALDPGAIQEQALRSHCGAARAAYNWAVSWVLASWSQRAAEETYGVSEDERTPWRPWSLPSLRREFNRVKKTDPRFASWWQENSKEAYNTGLAGAAAAFDNYAKSGKGRRKGPKMGLPRYKAKHKARLACRFTTGTIRIDDRRHVVLPRLGRIHVHEDLTGLLAKATTGDLRILSATVRHERGRWFVSFQVEERQERSLAARMQDAVGVDLGVKTLAVCADSTGEIITVPNPGHYEHALRQLRRASRKVSRRQGPDHRRGMKASRRWEKANAERNRLHHRIANLRENHLHQTTAALAAQYGTVVVEDLNVAGMMRNRRLSRRIAGASFAEVRRQLDYKTHRHGGRLITADRWYPSSKTCSGCGVAKAKLPLSCRVFECEACGLVLDRDENAARNLAALAARTTGTGVAGDQDAPGRRNRVEPTRRPAPPDPFKGPGRAGSETPRQRREARTVLKTPQLRRCGDTETDLQAEMPGMLMFD